MVSYNIINTFTLSVMYNKDFTIKYRYISWLINELKLNYRGPSCLEKKRSKQYDIKSENRCC